MKIEETGQNLSVIILTEPTRDWETYATWYSIYKNLPFAKQVIVSQRNNETPFAFFQWTKRLKINLVHKNKFDEFSTVANKFSAIKSCFDLGLINFPVMVVEPFVMVTEPLDENLLNIINDENDVFNKSVWIIKRDNINDYINNLYLKNDNLNTDREVCFEAKETNEIKSIISYEKGCGRWINTSKGCPIANAAGLVSLEMTVNEHRVIDLWKRMTNLYSTIT